jgi:hypothetical protein
MDIITIVLVFMAACGGFGFGFAFGLNYKNSDVTHENKIL